MSNVAHKTLTIQTLISAIKMLGEDPNTPIKINGFKRRFEGKDEVLFEITTMLDKAKIPDDYRYFTIYDREP